MNGLVDDEKPFVHFWAKVAWNGLKGQVKETKKHLQGLESI